MQWVARCHLGRRLITQLADQFLRTQKRLFACYVSLWFDTCRTNSG